MIDYHIILQLFTKCFQWCGKILIYFGTNYFGILSYVKFIILNLYKKQNSREKTNWKYSKIFSVVAYGS